MSISSKYFSVVSWRFLALFTLVLGMQGCDRWQKRFGQQKQATDESEIYTAEVEELEPGTEIAAEPVEDLPQLGDREDLRQEPAELAIPTKSAASAGKPTAARAEIPKNPALDREKTELPDLSARSELLLERWRNYRRCLMPYRFRGRSRYLLNRGCLQQHGLAQAPVLPGVILADGTLRIDFPASVRRRLSDTGFVRQDDVVLSVNGQKSFQGCTRGICQDELWRKADHWEISIRRGEKEIVETVDIESGKQ